jgi:predicted AlkP superfamily pyrophosphatase or phosphodiesterase
MYDMRIIAPTVCDVFKIRHPKSSEKLGLIKVTSTLETTKKLAVIVIDALGISTWRKAKKQTPTLNQIEKNHFTIIHSVMKSITPVNFATMLTGASPEKHKITERTMTLKEETIFDVMREHYMSSATAARAQSSLGILISPNADYPGIAESNLDTEVTEITVSKLNEGHNLLWVQLLDVDDAGHKYGPYSKESMNAVEKADINLMKILKVAQNQGYSVIVLADHGQHTTIDGIKGTHGTDISEDLEVPLLWANNSELGEILSLGS